MCYRAVGSVKAYTPSMWDYGGGEQEGIRCGWFYLAINGNIEYGSLAKSYQRAFAVLS
jgi:hypothetical protein